jgi:SAM-dependent methyltransferase
MHSPSSPAILPDMDRDAFALMADAEREHWWFRGRREFIQAAFSHLALPPNAHILDAGCGSGGNLPLLSRFGSVHGFEYDDQALEAARALGIGEVCAGNLPDGIPFASQPFDAIGLFDVLEHLEKPVESLTALRKRLTPSGSVVITVPANPWLWGPHDEVHQHFRRYTAASLRAHIAAAGLTVHYLSYFNSLLLPLAVAQRVRERVFGYSTENLAPAKTVNEMLFRVFRFERHWIPRWRAPLGLSLLAVAGRPVERTDGR